MLDPELTVEQDWLVTGPDGDISVRATSIFERLRMERQAADTDTGAAAVEGDSPDLADDSPDRPVVMGADGNAPATIPAEPSLDPAEPADLPRSDERERDEVANASEPPPDRMGIEDPAASSTERAAPGDAPSQAQVARASPDALVAAPALAPPPPDQCPAETAVLRPLPRVIAIANQKGGVGKTTTAVNLGAGLAELGFRVLVVDLDPQGNATTGLGVNSRNLEHSIYDVLLHDVSLDDCVEATSLRNLFVAPATIELAGAEIELVPAFSRELRLRRAIDEVRDDFDYVLIDCPPSLGLLTVNGLAAATEVLVPIQCEYYALEGLGQLLRNVNLVQGNLNPRLEVSTIVLTMFDARTKLAEQVAKNVRQHFGPKVCRNVVPRTVRLSEAPSFGQPVTLFDPTSRGSIAYRELAKEVSRGTSQRAG